MKFRVRSGDLNKIVKKDMFLKDWTETDLLSIIEEALDKEKSENLQLSDLTMISAVPFSKDETYWIETKSALKKLGLMKSLTSSNERGE